MADTKRSKRERKDQPVYMISIAARLAGMHPQTLRIYERKKLVRPERTEKSTRLYSERNIEQLKNIQKLTQEEGVNLAGVKIIMEMKQKLDELNVETDELRQRLDHRRREFLDEVKRLHQSYRRDLVLLPKGEIIKVINKADEK